LLGKVIVGNGLSSGRGVYQLIIHRS
jgi:hypothetical protein